ncbi:MAG: TIM barrel protein [Planctomycetota bacterium]|nr:TIM barrel protein [Planctomycetota bacterium]
MLTRPHIPPRLLVLLFACCLPPAHSSAADQPPRQPFFAFCMDTHDSQKRSLAEQAALLKNLGYDGCGHLWLDNLPERLKTLDAANLTLFQIYLRLDLSPTAKEPYDPRLKQILPHLKNRPTMLAILISNQKPSDPIYDPRAVQLLNEIADLAQPQNTRIALYPHRGDWLERPSDALRLVKQINRPTVGIMFNLCHYLATDTQQNLKPTLQSVLPHLFAISISGSDTASEIQSGKGNWIQPLGQGSFDMPAFLRLLDDLHYSAPIGLQCYGLPGDARDHLAQSMKAWRALSAQLQIN